MGHQREKVEVFFNGIDAATGSYLTPAIPLERLIKAVKSHEFPAGQYADLEHKNEGKKPGLPIPERLGDSSDLAISGWGLLFPATADPREVDRILAALDELIQWRKKQAGEAHCIILRGEAGFKWVNGKPETKNKFLGRHAVTPGNFDASKVPFHLLIVADPLSIPFNFQNQMDIDYACGRLYFQSLVEFARYAHSVVMAEKGQVALPRRVSFFGVLNRMPGEEVGESATAFSKKYLIDPLAKKIGDFFTAEKLEWQAEQIDPLEAKREALKSLLGGSQTPALLFSASHGVGGKVPWKGQVELQGGLVCADWQGEKSGPVQRHHYLAAADLPAASSPLGMMAFFFACYGAGTPYRDGYAVATHQKQTQIAHRPFLAALPMRLLGHPNGGALAVVGNVDRSYAYSFIFEKNVEQIQPFEEMILLLLARKTLGHALDWMNLRCASLAVSLKELLEEEYISPGSVDPRELVYLWTAVNDAEKYVVLGDPAVRLSVPAEKAKPAFALENSFTGNLPIVFDRPACATLPPIDRAAVAEEELKLGLGLVPSLASKPAPQGA